MSTLLKKLQVIEAEMITALDELSAAMDFLEKNAAPPGIRVRIMNSVIVATVSIVEEGMRGLFLEYLKELEVNIPEYKKLPKVIQKSNLACGIDLLKGSRNNLDDADPVLAQLGKCVESTEGYELFCEALTYNKYGFKSEHLSDMTKKIGFEGMWDKVSDDAAIQAYTNEDNLDARKNLIIAMWNEIFDERDTIVHRVSQASGWGKDRINIAISFFKMMMSRKVICLSSCAEDYLKQYSFSKEKKEEAAK